METEEGNASHVRRTSRARKINPKFFGDDAEYGSYKMLVDRITSSNFSGNRDNENSNSDASAIDPANIKSTDASATSGHSVLSSINIALKTVSVKIPKKSKSNISVNDNLKIPSGKVAPSVIVHCRSSTESEMSEDSLGSENEKRKPSSQGGNDAKKLKIVDSEDGKDKTLNVNYEDSGSSNIKVPSFINCSQLFRKSYVPLPIVSNLDRNQPKIVVTSAPKLNLPGKKLKIVSLKPITTIKKDTSSETTSKSNFDSAGNKLMLCEGGPVELKIVKKQVYPLSESNLPRILSKEDKTEPSKYSFKVEKISKPISPKKLFSSDGEDDIPLNKFMKQDVVKKKKKLTQKCMMKAKVKGKKLSKGKSNAVNDQDDLPLKAFIKKKSKTVSKGLSLKIKNTVSKKKETIASGQSSVENSQIGETSTKKKKNYNSVQKPKSSKLKIGNIKSSTSIKSQKIKSSVLKKKKIDSLNLRNIEKVKNGLGVCEKKIKKTKSKQFPSSENDSDSVTVKEKKGPPKLRFKFPKKVAKVTSTDSPLSSETTNIVISVSGIEGDYACVAIDKDHISVPCDDDDDDNVKSDTQKSKKILKSNFSRSPKKYTVDSGLVLEEDLFSATGISQIAETKGELSKVEPTSTDALCGLAEMFSAKESISKNESAHSKKEFASTKNESGSRKKELGGKKELLSEKEILIDSKLKVPTSVESPKKKSTLFNVDPTNTSCILEVLNNKDSATSELDSLSNNLDSSHEIYNSLNAEIKSTTKEIKAVDSKARLTNDSKFGHQTDKNMDSLSKELSYDNGEPSAKQSNSDVNEKMPIICKTEEQDIVNFTSNKMKISVGKAKSTKCTEIKKHISKKFNEFQVPENEVNSRPIFLKPEKNSNIGSLDYIRENKHNKTKEQKSYRETKSSKEVFEKENLMEDKEKIQKLEVKKDKEKDKRKEEKLVNLKADTYMNVDSDHHKHKNQKIENKKEKEKSFLHSLNDIKSEEKIKKEKTDSKDLIIKSSKDKNKDKLEKLQKDQKDLHGLRKLEKSYQSYSKVEKDSNKKSNLTLPKLNKDTNKLLDKKETKLEKECPVKDVISPVIKPKKRENFEEALLNIPLPKLSKSKKDRDEKGKKTPLKDKKIDTKDVRQEIHLLKHKEPEISKGFIKTDKPVFKSDLSSKEVKSEEKRHRKEERKHSNSSDKAEKKKWDYDLQDAKICDMRHDDEKLKRGERDRSRHSHKKHKREHSDHHRNHSLSSDKKKHRSDEKYDKKNNRDKEAQKEENKDIINKIMEDKEQIDIKAELNTTVDHSLDRDTDKLLCASHTKMEPKAEIIIDECYLINNRDTAKEEVKDAETFLSDLFPISNVSNIDLKIESTSNELLTTSKEIIQDAQENKCEISPIDINQKQKSEVNALESQILITETKIDNKLPLDVNESDLGILDELRDLKRTFEKPQEYKLVETGNVITSETEVNVIIPESPVNHIKVESQLTLQEACEKVVTSSLSTKSLTKEIIKSEVSDSLKDSDVKESSATFHSKLEMCVQKVSELKELPILESSSLVGSNSSESNLIEEQEFLNRKCDNLKSNAISSYSNITEDNPNISSSEKDETLPHYCNIPVSSIPLPNENIIESTSEKADFKASPLAKELFSSKEVSMCVSEPDEGFISEVSVNAREDFSSDGETPLTSDLSDDECLPTAMLSSASSQTSKELTPEEKEEMERRNQEIVQERMKSFELLNENLYLSEKVKNKRSKEVRRMVCDCTLTKEEITNGEMGCGDDCLNRLLMIECGSRCPLKEHCMNKKFQQRDYSNVEVFNASEKGCGVRSCEDIKQGTFIMEYIGEVFDTREFKRRRKEYAKSGSPHFYFMALRPDRLIDATRKGGISRFINHSCNPNAETQKWTVNGDIRIGFFATRHIPSGEEITFDYRLERYGREPQRCFCGTPDCRGWLGEPPDKKTKEEKEEDRRRELKDKQKKEAKRFLFEDMDLEDEIERLTVRGLRNRQDTLDLSRLMVRCEDSDSRLTLLKILESGEEASKRLFLDYHGLKLLWSWMVDISSSLKCITLKLEILKTLKSLPITNKTQVSDSRVIGIVERWSKVDIKMATKELQGETSAKKLSDGSDSDTENGDIKEQSPAETPSPPDDSSQDSNEVADVSTVLNKIEGEEREDSCSIEVEEEENKCDESHVTELSKQLLSVWSELKEAFKIPKKKRIEMMKEHEKEVDDEYAKYLDLKIETVENRTCSYYDGWRNTLNDRDKPKDYRDRFDRDRGRDRRWSKWRDSFDEEDKGLSKEQRRERFAKQVAKEEEEARQRKLQEEMWNLHLERCSLLGHDPYYTPIFDPSGQYYWDPDGGNWQAYSGPSGNLPVPASYGMNHSDVGVENICPNINSNNLFGSGAFYPLPHTPVSEVEEHKLGMTIESQSNNILDLSSIPLPGETPLTNSVTPNEASVVTIPLPGEENVESLNGIETPPMAPPGPVTIKLPPKWKIARDIDRRIYFYHTKTRHTQWELPTRDLHEKLMSCYGLTSDSESDLESDSDSSSSSDSEDFSSDEDDNDEDEPEADPVKKIENELNEKMIRRPKGKKIRSEKLVQERVISPILFEDREAARRERKEAKERARVEARKERYGMLKKNMSEENPRAVSDIVTSKSDVDKEGKLDLSEENIASPNENDDDDHLEEQLLKFSRKQKSESKSHFKAKGRSKERAITALADTSEIARKIKDNFRSRMATYIVSVLNPYRKVDCKEGRITSNDDFKYLARKLTHFVMVKELKQLPSIDGLDCSDSVKHKTKEFVRKYMSKYGDTFKRDPNDTKEY